MQVKVGNRYHQKQGHTDQQTMQSHHSLLCLKHQTAVSDEAPICDELRMGCKPSSQNEIAYF